MAKLAASLPCAGHLCPTESERASQREAPSARLDTSTPAGHRRRWPRRSPIRKGGSQQPATQREQRRQVTRRRTSEMLPPQPGQWNPGPKRHGQQGEPWHPRQRTAAALPGAGGGHRATGPEPKSRPRPRHAARLAQVKPLPRQLQPPSAPTQRQDVTGPGGDLSLWKRPGWRPGRSWVPAGTGRNRRWRWRQRHRRPAWQTRRSWPGPPPMQLRLQLPPSGGPVQQSKGSPWRRLLGSGLQCRLRGRLGSPGEACRPQP
mmetsp:Transcript_5192/g.22110  ORF Transcript_5192/g.22110 Transcript_5192/m.22110 type:complete len:260 (-) Transcript_5192:417-1196(-)